MRFFQIKFFIFLCAFLFISFVGVAQGREVTQKKPSETQTAFLNGAEVFMPGTQDIPLMSGLKVDVSDDMNFDTPAGQLITFEAKTKQSTGAQVLDYYRAVLPEMGWSETDKNHYQREKDTLIFTVIRAQKPAIIRVEITLMNAGD